MNRARCNNAVLQLFLFVLTLMLWSGIAVKAQGSVRTTRATHPVSNIAPSRQVGAYNHPFFPPDMAKLPSWVTLRQWSPNGTTRAPGDQIVPRQTILLSKSVPSAQFSVTPATAASEHPFWTADEKYIYFDSNRVDATDTGTTPRPDGIYNIFRMFPDGSGIVQVLPATVNQLEPVVSTDGGRLAFVGGGTIVSGAGTAHIVTSGFSLYLLNLNASSTAVPLTNVSGGPSFADVQHPTWSPGGNAIAFAGELSGQSVYHIFTVNVTTGQISQLTGGASSDSAPAWSPDGNVIAFQSNASGFPNGAAPAVAAGTKSNYDIWTVSTNPTSLWFSQATNFAVGGQAANNYSPAWSTLNVDPQGVIPAAAAGPGIQQSQEMLAFSSDREDTNNDGVANAINPNHSTDIYWLDTAVVAVQPGQYVDNTPETTGNVAHKLQTSQPDTAMNPTEPDYNFDLAHTTNEDMPTWPQYQRSYRIAFQSDRGGVEQLWASELIDINAPTLLKYDQNNNEIVHVALNSTPDVGARQFNAGDTVRFRVRAVDYQSGVESVFLQIKCPSSSERSADGNEHKIYVDRNLPLNTTDTILDVPVERDYQAVDAQPADQPAANAFPKFKANGVNGVGNTNWPGGNLYLPANDNVAFSGLANPPDVANWVSPLDPTAAPVQPADGQGGAWLQLYDDGPTTSGGHEPAGEVAGDGVFTGTWTTPAAFPSDWVIDVIVRDRAVDPFDTTKAVNWKIYDNVWGFTTKPFQSQSNVLFVDDYCSGQKFLNNRFGSGAFRNVGSIPTESWMTETSPALFPTHYLSGTTTGTLLGWQNTLGQFSYTDNLDSDGSGVPPTQRYDIWRIQCRGPLPVNILNLYAPFTVANPPASVSAGAPATVQVAQRCVIWDAPYTGDLFVGPGTLLDQSTQAELTNFVQTGGRLFVCGQDIAWGLTLGGGYPTNPFLTTVLDSTYVADTATPNGDQQINLTGTWGANPISYETWQPPIYHQYPGTATTTDNPPGLAGNFQLGPNAPKTLPDAVSADNQSAPDQITFTGISGSSGTDGTYDYNGSPAIVWNTNATTGSRVVFSPFGWEAIVPSAFSPTGATNTLIMQNWRTELLHNVLDYLRTGRIIGTARVINAQTGATSPLAGVLVSAISPKTGAVVSAAVTQSDGTYNIQGLPPDGIYTVIAVKSGYVTQHVPGSAFHGGYQSTTDFYMTQAQPGTITGHVLTQTTNLPVGQAVVTATDTTDPTNPSPATFTAVSNPTDGSYTIQNVPANATYSLAVTNAAALGYSGTVEGTYTGIAVTPQGVVSGKDFHMKQLPGTISGFVHIATATGTDTGTPIAGATVTATGATPSGGGTAPTFTATTATDGTYTINSVDVGTYTVVATASGYAASTSASATVASQQNTPNINFLLKTVPAGSITGLVETSTGIPVSGATVTVTTSNGGTFTATTGAVQNGTDTNGNAITYNYSVPNVPAGTTVTVTAAKSGYTAAAPTSITVTINPGAASNGVNLLLNPLAIFSNGLSLVSSPYTYTVGGAPEDVATLLSVPQSDVTDGAFQFIYWNSATQQYVSHPTPPADTFHLGNGYFMLDSNSATALALTTLGTPAPQTAGVYNDFNIPLAAGWNMIGCPFTSPVDFTKLQVKLPSGQLEDMLTAQSGPNPVLGAALWTFQNGAYGVVYTLDPYRGYYLQAFQPCTLVVLSSAQQSRGVASSHSGRALEYATSTTGSWKLDLVASTNQATVSRAVAGQYALATNGYDVYKMQEPPVATNKNVTISFQEGNWGAKSGNYAVDVRSTTANTWHFTVQSNVPNAPVTLTWPNLATVGRRSLMVTDMQTGQTFNLADRAAYVIPGGPAGVTRQFTLNAEAASRGMLQVLDLATNLASTRADGAVSAANITCTLTRDASVTVNIMHNGQPVRTLVAGQTRAAGPVTVTWDLKDNSGIRVPTGSYQVQLTAVDANGHRVPMYVPLVITR